MSQIAASNSNNSSSNLSAWGSCLFSNATSDWTKRFGLHFTLYNGWCNTRSPTFHGILFPLMYFISSFFHFPSVRVWRRQRVCDGGSVCVTEAACVCVTEAASTHALFEHVRLVPQRGVLAQVLLDHLHPLHLQTLQLLQREGEGWTKHHHPNTLFKQGRILSTKEWFVYCIYQTWGDHLLKPLRLGLVVEVNAAHEVISCGRNSVTAVRAVRQYSVSPLGSSLLPQNAACFSFQNVI